MSMLTAQCENLRIMARLVRDYDYREISRALRESADTIENLRNRLTETCHMVLKDDHEEYGEAFYVWWECDECGCTLPKQFGMPEIRYCPNCGREVVR